MLVTVSIALNLTLLIGSRDQMPWFLKHAGVSQWDWVFPLGLSFYVFQALTYTLDLSRRNAQGTHSLLEHFSRCLPRSSPDLTRVADLVKQFAAPPV